MSDSAFPTIRLGPEPLRVYVAAEVYCPDCAEREFGDTSVQEEAQS